MAQHDERTSISDPSCRGSCPADPSRPDSVRVARVGHTAPMRMRADVVIAGAGIAGIATAWQVAVRLGTTSTVIVDPRPPLSLTSDRPEANYRDWWPQPAMVALAHRSQALVESLLAAGEDIDMNRRGYLYVTADPETADGFPGIVDRHVAAGVAATDVDLLGPDDLAARFPHLSQGIRGGIHARRAGSLDTVGLGRAMLRLAQAAGVRVVRGEVAGGAVAGGRLQDVEVAGPEGEYRISTDRFVNAAGPFAGQVARRFMADLDLETVLRQKVIVRDPLGIVPRDAPFTIGLDRTGGLPAGVHLKPDGPLGADTIKLGWASDQTPADPVADPACPPDFPAIVLDRAATIVPGLRAYLGRPDVVAHDGGFYARTPDGLPVIGPHGPEGCHVVGGLAGFGAMMACAAGEIAAASALGDTIPRSGEAFEPRRFGREAAGPRRPDGSPPPGEL